MKKSILGLAALAGMALWLGGTQAFAHDPYHHHRGNGHYHHGNDYRFRPGVGYGGGYFRPVPQNQLYFSTPGLTIGLGGPVYRVYQPGGFYGGYGRGYYNPGCGW